MRLSLCNAKGDMYPQVGVFLSHFELNAFFLRRAECIIPGSGLEPGSGFVSVDEGSAQPFRRWPSCQQTMINSSKHRGLIVGLKPPLPENSQNFCQGLIVCSALRWRALSTALCHCRSRSDTTLLSSAAVPRSSSVRRVRASACSLICAL